MWPFKDHLCEYKLVDKVRCEPIDLSQFESMKCGDNTVLSRMVHGTTTFIWKCIDCDRIISHEYYGKVEEDEV